MTALAAVHLATPGFHQTAPRDGQAPAESRMLCRSGVGQPLCCVMCSLPLFTTNATSRRPIGRRSRHASRV